MRLRSALAFCAALAVVFGLAVGPAAAQTVTPVGTASTFDIAAWNVEFFGRTDQGPTNEPLQFHNILTVLRQAQVDLWTMEEVTDPPTFQRLLDSLSASGYVGVLGPSVSGNPTFDQRLAFVYNPAVVQPIQTGTILTGTNFGGRAPLQMRANVTLADTTLEIRFIALHAKAGGSSADRTDRLNGAIALKNYIDNLILTGAHVVLMGDYNDRLTTSIAGGTSPYQNFRDDPTDYVPLTLAMDTGGAYTYCSNVGCTSGTTLDHIMVTTNLNDEFQAVGRYVALLNAFDAFGGEFVTTTSDHLPVWARFNIHGTTAAEPGATARTVALAPPAPNPARGLAVLTYALETAADVKLEVLDVLGRRVALVESGLRSAGTHHADLDAGALAPGLYLVRLTADGQTATQRLVRQ